jgi:hypothetical protein
MATIQGAGGLGPDDLYDYSWLGLVTNGDLGNPVTIPTRVRELSLQMAGTIAGSLAVQLQGSMDNVSYSQLKDISGNAISLTDTSVIRFTNPPKYIKPVATAGSGGASANIYIHGTVVGG